MQHQQNNNHNGTSALKPSSSSVAAVHREAEQRGGSASEAASVCSSSSHSSSSSTATSYHSSRNTSVHSAYSTTAQQQQRASVSYEPGTGAAFMAQSGWTNREEYGRVRQQQQPRSTAQPPQSTAFPVFTPAPRPSRLGGEMALGGGAPSHQQRTVDCNGVRVQQQHQEPHQISFSEAPNYKKVYLIALIIVTMFLLSLIALVVFLLATKVFIYNTARTSSSSTPNSITASPTLLPSVQPTDSSNSDTLSFTTLLPAPAPSTMAQPRLVTRTFECEFYILDQANQAYANENSFEQYQARQIVRNALLTTLEASSLRDLNPNIALQKLENNGPDLRILFRLSIVVLEQNTGIRETAIRNLLLSEAGFIEGLLNRTSMDRNRIAVRLIS